MDSIRNLQPPVHVAMDVVAVPLANWDESRQQPNNGNVMRRRSARRRQTTSTYAEQPKNSEDGLGLHVDREV